MQQAQIVLRFLFITHQQFAEAVQPRMRSFHFPPPGRLLAATNRFGLLSDLPHMGDVTTISHDHGSGLSAVSLIGAQILPTPTRRFGAPNHNAVQGFRQQLDIMSVGPADDKGERDASPVDQQAAFGPFFSPDLWGCCPPLPKPTELYPGCRQCSAIPKRSLPDHRIRPNPPATDGEKIRQRAIAENDGEPPWRCQNSWAGLSTGSPSATHTRWRQTRRAASRICARPRGVADIFAPLPESRESEPTASPETRVPPTLPTSRFCSCRQRARAHKRCKRYLGIISK